MNGHMSLVVGLSFLCLGPALCHHFLRLLAYLWLLPQLFQLSFSTQKLDSFLELLPSYCIVEQSLYCCVKYLLRLVIRILVKVVFKFCSIFILYVVRLGVYHVLIVLLEDVVAVCVSISVQSRSLIRCVRVCKDLHHTRQTPVIGPASH